MIDEERAERAAASRLRAHQLLERTAYVAEIGEAGKVEEEFFGPIGGSGKDRSQRPRLRLHGAISPTRCG